MLYIREGKATDFTSGPIVSDGTGIYFGGGLTTPFKFNAATTTRAIDIQVTPTTADRMLYMDIDYGSNSKEAAYIISSSAKTSGETTALRARGQGKAAGSSTAEIRGVHAQGIAFAALYTGTVNALYAEAIAKGTSTVTTIRGAMIACDSESTPTSIGTMLGAHVRIKTSVAPGTAFEGLRVESEKFGSGVLSGAAIRVIDTTWSSAETPFTVGLLLGTTGIMTTGISITAPTATGISISGTVSGSAIQVGVAGGTALTLTNSSHALEINTSHSALTGTVRSAEIIQAMLVEDYSTINEVLYVNFDSSVLTGDWANAIVGRINYTAPGNANGGMAAAICGEMSMPAAAQTGGSYYCIDAELECPTSFTCAASAANPVAFIKCGVWGDATAVNSFEAGGYLLHIDGVASGTDYMFEEVTVTAAQVFDAVLKINVGGADYFIGLCDDKTFA